MNNPLIDNSIVDEEILDSEIEYIFSEEELENISGLCSTLQKIRKRLISEGYSIDELRKKLLEGKM